MFNAHFEERLHKVNMFKFRNCTWDGCKTNTLAVAKLPDTGLLNKYQYYAYWHHQHNSNFTSNNCNKTIKVRKFSKNKTMTILNY